jgi:hypothetical protein
VLGIFLLLVCFHQLDKATADAAEFKAGFDKYAADAAEYKAGYDKLLVDTTEQRAQVGGLHSSFSLFYSAGATCSTSGGATSASYFTWTRKAAVCLQETYSCQLMHLQVAVAVLVVPVRPLPT